MMMLFSPPRCDFRVPSASGRQTVAVPFTTQTPSVLAWLVDSLSTSPSPRTREPANQPSSVRSSHPHSSPQPSSPSDNKEPRTSLSCPMSFDYDYYPCGPRSPAFEPILGSITEAAEFEDASDVEVEAKPVRPALTKIDSASQDVPEAFIPDISIGVPELTTKTAKGTVIQFARMTTAKATSVRRVLRKVLEADKVRRRKALKVYLKALTFLRYMLKAHDRYGSAMMTTGMYMPR
ncbi:hypothetical protein ST47_g10044 [Ascochyta rabiei]|uniref:Uncharacterized protein n=2 Tax=Didymella rabiei TaxID=5454 RepID=A0A162W623_DIDRA|nr:hypothetical protein ST47_g10044 [Ascochyta rabiei]